METPTHQQIRAWLEREIALGLEAVPRPAALVPQHVPAVAAPAATTPAPPRSVVVEAPRRAPLSDLVEPEVRAAASLEALREVLGDCRRCKLCKGRKNIVFGVGNPNARLMFVGEGPGEDEDMQGEPFVGKAGALLTDIITKGMGLARSDVYIANVVKCRPPNNRDPEPDEIVACEPFLKRQVALVGPEVIVSLGKFATQVLLGDRTPISRRRGQWHQYEGRPLMPTFHPAYLLRTPSDKGLVWADIKLVMERLGIPLPAPKSERRS
jgi:uracil-DNA glycosylase family 4